MHYVSMEMGYQLVCYHWKTSTNPLTTVLKCYILEEREYYIIKKKKMDTGYFRKLLAAPSPIKNFSFSRQYALTSHKPQSLCEIPRIFV